MNFRNTAIIAVLSIFALQSCKKEVATTSISNNDSMKTDAMVTDSLTTVKPEIKSMDSAAGIEMFSALKNKKVSLDKDAVTLTSVKEGSPEKAYLIFNDDQSKVEVFLPGEKKGILYDRKGTEGNYTWTDGKNELIQWKGYVLRTLKQAIPLFNGDSM
ncbi:hypothetical protein IV494_00340 [Kaistella sp. G5-32]|uniref:Lipoprotein n=1 Tax=Kaistella gelatinilytica TaxID=2787636 RepID=A0ABS0F7D6_9FLAO|nr:hypothetical protein [Kaistella gelatinilytica]MBF8455616.1 hypothetical protein [Kaistella gelatinilytica]